MYVWSLTYPEYIVVLRQAKPPSKGSYELSVKIRGLEVNSEREELRGPTPPKKERKILIRMKSYTD
jgi:hypothetical protein